MLRTLGETALVFSYRWSVCLVPQNSMSDFQSRRTLTCDIAVETNLINPIRCAGVQACWLAPTLPSYLDDNASRPLLAIRYLL